MHAEGGGTPAGEAEEGFQIWLNTPSALKMADPRYGTHPPSQLPLLQLGGGSTARLLAGALGAARGPFQSAADVQIADYSLAQGAAPVAHALAAAHDNCLVYCYRGAALVGGTEVRAGHVARLDMGSGGGERTFELAAAGGAGAGAASAGGGGQACGLLVFAGKQLRQPIAWHGPFVMTTQEEVREALAEYRAGTLLKVRAPWDFQKASATPPAAKPKGEL